MLRKRWVKKLDDLISINLVLPFVHHLVGKALLAGVTDLEAKNCHNQVRRQSGRPGVGEGVCKCVSGRPGAQNRRLGVGGGVYVGNGDVGRPSAQNWRLGVSVVVQEGGVGVLGALGAGFGRLVAQLFSSTFNGVSGLKPIVNYRVLYINAKLRMLTL
ncbi:hypothetical protein PIB30_085341 [Stylosanthes scabra]|uniref:Uncharacterized protein n=1 Tax=Stylosanthes scabra TaxID=79078 RepID=A0ABU6XS72_9FABA|nr:hypothetical protein [Stylosanthes scabra]